MTPAPQCARLPGGVAAAAQAVRCSWRPRAGRERARVWPARPRGVVQCDAPRPAGLQRYVARRGGYCDGSWRAGLCASAPRAARPRDASGCGQALPAPQPICASRAARPSSPPWTRARLSGHGGRASRPYVQPRSAYARAWLHAWPPSGACVRASALPWRCARAAWRRPPAAAPAREAQPGCPVRCLSSSSVGSRRERRGVSHKREAVATAGTYPQNLCITMWTDAARARKPSAPARACIMMNGFSPARPAV